MKFNSTEIAMGNNKTTCEMIMGLRANDFKGPEARKGVKISTECMTRKKSSNLKFHHLNLKGMNSFSFRGK